MNKRILSRWFSLLNVDYVKLGTKWNYACVISPYYRLYYIDDGNGTISGSNTTLTLQKGYIYLIPSFTLCNLKCENTLGQYFIQFFEESADGISLFQNNREPMKILASELDIAIFKRLLKVNPGRGINRSDNPEIYEKNIYYKEYQELNNRQSVATQMETQGIIQQLLSRFLNSSTFKKKEHEPIPSTVLNAVSYIQINLKNQLRVIDLAKRANQHPDYFSRLFLKHMGTRPITYINEKRIERAQYLIITTHISLDQVAVEVGYDTTPYFSKIFKKITGLTPGKYTVQNKSYSDLG
ncbi:AraC family transcriptional regulator [Pedobacter frigiditerrae]|uniref:AraC family transcriptional regulator n=1 Tax=Pedobacter frigiditerrae TaxID=2530452 RepID=A0A4V2MIU5_9SPHI|nr:AraC family transcriptional regulator [Pedobacter frigiditerrae]TCC91726.1 AraC family transcriptional regulator [Pedobacter frigiditerrae]